MITIKNNGKKVWVTFTFSANEEVSDVAICGEWSSWKEEPMKQKKSGDYYITKVLKPDSRFEFGYKVNDKEWLTDDACPKVTTPYLSENSLLEI